MVTPQQRFPDLLHAHLDQAGNQHLDRPSRPRAGDDLWALDAGLRPARSYRFMDLSLVGPPRSNTGQSPKRVLRSNLRRGWSEGRRARRESRQSGGSDGWAKSQDLPNGRADGGSAVWVRAGSDPGVSTGNHAGAPGAPSVIAADAGVTPSWAHHPWQSRTRGEVVVGSVMWPVTDERVPGQRSRPPAGDDQAVVASDGGPRSRWEVSWGGSRRPMIGALGPGTTDTSVPH